LGIEVSRCRTDTDPDNLCPRTDRSGTLNRIAYALGQVNDPAGPFDGSWFVESHNVKVLAAALYNPNLRADSTTRHRDPDHPGKKVNWFTLNLRRGTDVRGYVRAIHQHETWGKGGSPQHPKKSGHVGAVALYLLSKPVMSDPSLALEAEFAATEATAASHADDTLRRIEQQSIHAAKDPRPAVWRGRLWWWNSFRHRWINCHDIVDGDKTRPLTCNDADL
jgi:hypothetical protein